MEMDTKMNYEQKREMKLRQEIHDRLLLVNETTKLDDVIYDLIIEREAASYDSGYEDGHSAGYDAGYEDGEYYSQGDDD